MTDPFERAVEREREERDARVNRYVRLGFAYHLRAYVMVNVLLVAIWLLTTGPESHPWPVYPVLGWGIGLYFHWTVTRLHHRDGHHLRAGRGDE